MDARAKQRLTGAIILVALFVLLVPELLTGPKTAHAPATPEEEGLRRYTIDLDASATTNPGGVNPSPETPVTLPPVAANAPTSGLAQPGEEATPEPAPVPESAASERAPAPVASAPATTRPTPAPSASTTTPATRSAAAATPVPAQPNLPKGSFVVQLGSFGSKDNAERLVRDMTAKGFTTFISPITTNGRELYRVRVGPARDRASAEALAARLKRAGQSGAIVEIS